MGSPAIADKTVYALGQLNVNIEAKSIGGYRGQAGTVSIRHISNKVFTKWDKKELKDLATLTETILKIQENAGIFNTLIYGRQDGENFNMIFVPYPKCNWIEKIQGLVHIVFGASSLKQKQLDEIAKFYEDEFKKVGSYPNVTRPLSKRPDPFSDQAVIDRQKIMDFSSENRHYHLLLDNQPKGATSEDLHVLIMPSGKDAHQQGSDFSVEKRFDMNEMMQEVMQVFLKQNFQTLIFEERVGPDLPSVSRKHFNVKGILNFPQTLWAKIKVVLRLIWPAKLSDQEMNQRITPLKNEMKPV